MIVSTINFYRRLERYKTFKSKERKRVYINFYINYSKDVKLSDKLNAKRNTPLLENKKWRKRSN